MNFSKVLLATFMMAIWPAALVVGELVPGGSGSPMVAPSGIEGSGSTAATFPSGISTNNATLLNNGVSTVEMDFRTDDGTPSSSNFNAGQVVAGWENSETSFTDSFVRIRNASGGASYLNTATFKGGRLGLTVDDPQALLHLEGSAGALTAPIIRMHNTSQAQGEWEITTNDATNVLNIKNLDSATNIIKFNSSGSTELSARTDSDCGIGNICSGSFTSTCTATTNLASCSIVSMNYTRVGNVVTVFGRWNLNHAGTTANSDIDFKFTVPFATFTAGSEQASGNMLLFQAGFESFYNCGSNNGTNEVRCQGRSNDNTNILGSQFNISYVIP